MDSNTTKPIFEKSAKELHQILDAGQVDDTNFLAAVLSGYREHNKVRNRELNEKIHQFNIAKILNLGDVDRIKEVLDKVPA